MKLPSWIYLVVGVGMALLSLRMVLAGQKMGIFLLVGVGMAVFGIIRLFIEGREAKPQSHEPTIDDPRHPRHQHLRPGSAAPATAGGAPANALPRPVIPRICSNCGARNNPHANYCGHCGQRIRGD